MEAHKKSRTGFLPVRPINHRSMKSQDTPLGVLGYSGLQMVFSNKKKSLANPDDTSPGYSPSNHSSTFDAKNSSPKTKSSTKMLLMLNASKKPNLPKLQMNQISQETDSYIRPVRKNKTENLMQFKAFAELQIKRSETPFVSEIEQSENEKREQYTSMTLAQPHAGNQLRHVFT